MFFLSGLLLALLSLPASSHASDWLPIETSIDGERYYVDLHSIKTSGQVVTFWSKNVDKKGEVTTTRFSIHCGDGTAAMRDVILHGPDDSVIKSYSYKENNLQWITISPHSFLKSFQYFLCKDKSEGRSQKKP